MRWLGRWSGRWSTVVQRVLVVTICKKWTDNYPDECPFRSMCTVKLPRKSSLFKLRFVCVRQILRFEMLFEIEELLHYAGYSVKQAKTTSSLGMEGIKEFEQLLSNVLINSVLRPLLQTTCLPFIVVNLVSINVGQLENLFHYSHHGENIADTCSPQRKAWGFTELIQEFSRQYLESHS